MSIKYKTYTNIIHIITTAYLRVT